MIVRIIILIVLLSLQWACDQQQNEDGRDLRIGIEDQPRTLDPRYATDAFGMRIANQLIFSSLVRHGYDLKMVPGVAERWTCPNDRTYLFHLRPDIHFHDGTALNAEDVKFTLEHLMAAATQSPFGNHLRDKISKVELINALTVSIHLKRPTAAFLTLMTLPILPKHVILKSEAFSKDLTGSGPFRFHSRSPNEVILISNDKYFEGRPKLRRLIFKVVTDDNTRFLKVKKGELDLLINALPTDRIDDFKKTPLNRIYRVVEGPGIAYNYLAFNMQDSILKKRRVRKAVAYGIDVEEIIRYRLNGHARRAKGLLSPINWYHEPDVRTYPYRPEKAKILLDKAGFEDPDGDGPKPRITLELKTSNNRQVVSVARIIRAQLAKIGILLNIRSYEWGTFYGDVKSGNFQLTSMRWVGVTEPDFFFDIFHSSQVPPAGRNRGRYRNTYMDQLVELGRYTMDPMKRKAIYSKVQKEAADDLPYVSLWHLNNVTVVNRRMKGYRQHPMGSYHAFKDIRIE